MYRSGRILDSKDLSSAFELDVPIETARQQFQERLAESSTQRPSAISLNLGALANFSEQVIAFLSNNAEAINSVTFPLPIISSLENVIFVDQASSEETIVLRLEELLTSERTTEQNVSLILGHLAMKSLLSIFKSISDRDYNIESLQSLFEQHQVAFLKLSQLAQDAVNVMMPEKIEDGRVFKNFHRIIMPISRGAEPLVFSDSDAGKFFNGARNLFSKLAKKVGVEAKIRHPLHLPDPDALAPLSIISIANNLKGAIEICNAYLASNVDPIMQPFLPKEPSSESSSSYDAASFFGLEYADDPVAETHPASSRSSAGSAGAGPAFPKAPAATDPAKASRRMNVAFFPTTVRVPVAITKVLGFVMHLTTARSKVLHKIDSHESAYLKRQYTVMDIQRAADGGVELLNICGPTQIHNATYKIEDTYSNKLSLPEMALLLNFLLSKHEYLLQAKTEVPRMHHDRSATEFDLQKHFYICITQILLELTERLHNLEEGDLEGQTLSDHIKQTLWSLTIYAIEHTKGLTIPSVGETATFHIGTKSIHIVPEKFLYELAATFQRLNKSDSELADVAEGDPANEFSVLRQGLRDSYDAFARTTVDAVLVEDVLEAFSAQYPNMLAELQGEEPTSDGISYRR